MKKDNEITIAEVTDVKCPLCDAEMTGKTNTQSFMWVCKECPAILFEFYSEDDIKFLEMTL